MTAFFDSILTIIQDWLHAVHNELPKVFLALIIFLIFLALAYLFRGVYVKIYSHSKNKEKAWIQIFGSLIFMFFIFSGIYLSLKTIGIEKMFSNILAGAGIVGIIAGFAFKDVASNIFAGLLLKIHHPIKEGDWVEIDKNYGTIYTIGWITTSIKTENGQEVFVPNQIIYNQSFINFSSFGKRTIVLEMGVSDEKEGLRVKQISKDELSKTQGVILDEEINFYFKEITPSEINCQLRFWITFDSQTNFLEVTHQCIESLYHRFEKENITLTTPINSPDCKEKT